MLKKFFFCLLFGLCASLAADVPFSQQTVTQVKADATVRKDYPDEVFNILKKYVKTDAFLVDLDCGTGIETRQLCQNGFKKIIGVDRDLEKLREARAIKISDCNIQYTEGDVSQRLPFPNGYFDVATMFSFSNLASIKDVARILKPEGYYFIVRTDETANAQNPVKKEVLQIMEKGIGHSIPKIEDPTPLLEKGGFQILYNTPIIATHDYSKEEYLSYLQSMNAWNSVKNSTQPATILKQIGDYLDKAKDSQGHINESKTIQVILAQKKAKP